MTSVAPFVSDVPLALHESMPETKAISFANSESEFFENLLDVINPLQHIPGVSTIYRAITGDQIGAPARLVGGALFGGPIGFASAAANLLLEDATGDDLSGHLLALVGDLGDAPELADAAVPAAFAPRADAPEIDLTAAVADPASAPEGAPGRTVTDGGAEIIWNGPRVLPSLTRAPSAASGAAADHPESPAAAAQTRAAQPPPGGQPAWLGAAIADAKTVHGAAQLGKAAQKVEAQPWVADAMLQALEKYDALARERSR